MHMLCTILTCKYARQLSHKCQRAPSIIRVGGIQVAEKAPQVGGSVLDLFADNPLILVGTLFLAAIPLALNFLGGDKCLHCALSPPLSTASVRSSYSIRQTLVRRWLAWGQASERRRRDRGPHFGPFDRPHRYPEQGGSKGAGLAELVVYEKESHNGSFHTGAASKLSLTS